jgi:hypothetical protein
MKIEKIFIERKGQTILNTEITEVVKNSFLLEDGQFADINCLSVRDKLTLKIESIPEHLIPAKSYKNKVKNPLKIQVDILISFRQADFVSEYIRFKQPDPNGKNVNSDKINIITPKIEWTYMPKTDDQLIEWYKNKVDNRISEFENENDFLSWYENNIKDSKCAYCGLSERDSQRLVHEGKLKSLRFPIYGTISSGVNRGYWLEIDRKIPTGYYSKENCNPSCYFCNNDKSDVFTDSQYKEFYENRASFLRGLLILRDNKVVIGNGNFDPDNLLEQ